MIYRFDMEVINMTKLCQNCTLFEEVNVVISNELKDINQHNKKSKDFFDNIKKMVDDIIVNPDADITYAEIDSLLFYSSTYLEFIDYIFLLGYYRGSKNAAN